MQMKLKRKGSMITTGWLAAPILVNFPKLEDHMLHSKERAGTAE